MQDPANRLRAFMDRKGLTQITLAKAAKVSQSTVSRALAGDSIRHGQARAKLFKYAGISEWTLACAGDNPRKQVLAAFNRVWDHSPSHAEAIAKVIEALADLRPTRGGGKR